MTSQNSRLHCLMGTAPAGARRSLANCHWKFIHGIDSETMRWINYEKCGFTMIHHEELGFTMKYVVSWRFNGDFTRSLWQSKSLLWNMTHSLGFAGM